MNKEEKEIKIAEVEEKRLSLEEKHKTKVHAFYFDTEEFGFVVGYYIEPPRYTKRKVLDLFQIGQYSHAAEVLTQVCLIKEESSPLILSEDPKYDELVLGFEHTVQELVKFYVNGEKKS
jgi:hypothetical protein